MWGDGIRDGKHEQISKNDKVGGYGLNQARLEDHEGLCARSKAQLELRR